MVINFAPSAVKRARNLGGFKLKALALRDEVKGAGNC
jgi:hypothetical protein